MPDLDLSVINAALTRTGNDPITALDDGTAAAAIASKNYELFVAGVLSGYPWRWATKTKMLTMLAGTPAPPWLYAYQRPTDVLKLRTVQVDGAPIGYEVQYDKVLTDIDEGYEVIAKYTWRPPEANWPGFFTEPMIQHMEAMFLRSIGHQHSEAKDREISARREMKMAKLADAQSQTPIDPASYPTLEARRA